MRKVVQTSEVFHLFANKIQSEARNQTSNVYFNSYNDNFKLYSYGAHYLLASFIDNNTILINDTGYSVTTSKHINEIRYASNHLRQFFTTNTEMKQVYYYIKYNLDKLANARKPEIYINNILDKFNKLNEFIVYTKNKDIKKSKDYKELKRIVKNINTNLDSYKGKLKDRKLKQIKAKKRADAKYIKDNLTKFYSYEKSTLYGLDSDFVRMSKDNLHIETSRNIKVTSKAAKVLYKMILANKNIEGIKIEGYTVISINGTLKIGCHNININSVHKVGKQLLKLDIS